MGAVGFVTIMIFYFIDHMPYLNKEINPNQACEKDFYH